ncbi:hypothetical protein RSSM_01155 [Rhodopirellula sallentina SM41]|uniref:Uncharacterized protein n=1 Tax=Rhodopirellula sallentina SM41 TaxID=1263870 RepID=M5U7S1_9BACT|nr:hypothetical protein RSSM_01155 [Rhodopirellula sallentina SM41]
MHLLAENAAVWETLLCAENAVACRECGLFPIGGSERLHWSRRYLVCQGL